MVYSQRAVERSILKVSYQSRVVPYGNFLCFADHLGKRCWWLFVLKQQWPHTFGDINSYFCFLNFILQVHGGVNNGPPLSFMEPLHTRILWVPLCCLMILTTNPLNLVSGCGRSGSFKEHWLGTNISNIGRAIAPPAVRFSYFYGLGGGILVLGILDFQHRNRRCRKSALRHEHFGYLTVCRSRTLTCTSRSWCASPG